MIGRRIFWLGLAVVLVAGLFGFGRGVLEGLSDGGGAVARTVYPLEHDDAIVAAARRHKLDPALIAAMIYVESGFDESARSKQGAVGLMQVLPETAGQIARETGGTEFVADDLEDPKVNVRYGTYYLRSTLDDFDGNVLAAVAAYNAGGGPVAEWRAAAAEQGRELSSEDIRYAETRAYVDDVLRLRRVYRETYGDRLNPDQ